MNSDILKNNSEKLNNKYNFAVKPENCECDAEFNKIFFGTNFRAIKGYFYKIEQNNKKTEPL